MIIQILMLITILGLLNSYVVIRIINYWPLASENIIITLAVAIIFFLMQLAGPFGDRLVFPKLKSKMDIKFLVTFTHWISSLALGIFSCLVFYSLVIDIVGIALQLSSFSLSILASNYYALITLIALTSATVLVGIYQALKVPTICKIDIPLKDLPRNFDGFKIVQISDLHIGPTIKGDYVKKIVDIVNDLKPDLVALTGDFIDGTVEDLKEDAAPLANIMAPHGVFFVTGNHEYYWGAVEWINEFTNLGARVLSNQHVIINYNNEKIILAGVTDYSTRHMQSEHASNPSKALEGAPDNLKKILLAHQPVSYKMAYKAGFDLQLSGHTHAGQYFPFNIIVYFFQHFYKGLNRYNNMWIYINRGTGYWGPPLRTGVPSEITLVTLRSK